MLLGLFVSAVCKLLLLKCGITLLGKLKPVAKELPYFTFVVWLAWRFFIIVIHLLQRMAI